MNQSKESVLPLVEGIKAREKKPSIPYPWEWYSEKVQWMAMDEDGQVYGFAEEPRPHVGVLMTPLYWNATVMQSIAQDANGHVWFYQGWKDDQVSHRKDTKRLHFGDHREPIQQHVTEAVRFCYIHHIAWQDSRRRRPRKDKDGE